jgi:hypothetical protein
MPLRDHFRPPLDDRRSWDEVHGQWPAMIVLHLSSLLPEGYEAAPHVHLGSSFEVDVAAYDPDNGPANAAPANCGATTALAVETDLPEQDEYEVRVYDARRGRRLVATLELVSPANEDRPAQRATFVAKCLALLQQRVSVSIIDIVTIRSFNLYADLLAQLGQADSTLSEPPAPLYAVTCRARSAGDGNLLQGWSYPLAIGEPLPNLPLWLADDVMVLLDLEACYEQTCKVLRIP